jgi:hypothetical protein
VKECDVSSPCDLDLHCLHRVIPEKFIGRNGRILFF